MHHNVHIDADVHIGEGASTCAISYDVPGSTVPFPIHVVGVAKRHPNDRPDNVLAEILATARALTTLASRLNDRAQHMIDGNYHPGREPF